MHLTAMLKTLRSRRLWPVLLAAGLMLGLSACGGHRVQPAATPVPHPPTAQPANPASFLPTPPLVDPHAPTPRHISAGTAPLTASQVASHDTGGQTGPGAGGAYAIIPGAQDELGWAMYEVPMSDSERPAGVQASTLAIIPGAQDELSFWVAAYSFSEQSWEWIGPDDGAPAPWHADGQIALSLNSPTRRARFCNLSNGASVQSYIAIVTQPQSQGGGGGLTVNPGTLSIVAQDDPSFVKTEPLPASIPGINVDGANNRIQLFFDNFASDGADGVLIQRRSLASAQWVNLAKPSTVPTNFNDPDDDDPGVVPPVLTAPYEYRAVAFTRDNGRELDAGPSNYQRVHGWAAIEIAAGGAAGSLAQVDGCPAVAFHANGTDVHYAISATPIGALPSEWHGVVFGNQNGSGMDYSLKNIAGAPCIGFYDASAKQMVFLRAFDKRGLTTWTTALVEASTDDLGFNCSLADIGGSPAVVYCDKTTNTLHYNRSTTTLGNQGDWGTPVVLPGATGVGYSPCLIALSNGHPAVACYDDGGDQVVFGAATSADGMLDTDWTGQFSPVGSVGITSTPPLSRFISLALIAGNPSVSYWNVGNGNLYFQRAADALGATSWSLATVDNDNIAESNSLAEVPDGAGGFAPAVGYCAMPQSIEEPHYCQCGDSLGADGSWNELQTVASPGSAAGAECSLALIGGRPAMVYDGPTGLMYAIYF